MSARKNTETKPFGNSSPTSFFTSLSVLSSTPKFYQNQISIILNFDAFFTCKKLLLKIKIDIKLNFLVFLSTRRPFSEHRKSGLDKKAEQIHRYSPRRTHLRFVVVRPERRKKRVDSFSKRRRLELGRRYHR